MKLENSKMRMENNKTAQSVPKWKMHLLAGSALAMAACGGVDIENMVPIGSKHDASVSDINHDSVKDMKADGLKTDSATKADSRKDGPSSDFMADAKAKDAKSTDSKPADAKPSDKGMADACVTSKGALSCSNSYPMASGLLQLGGSFDLKGIPTLMPLMYTVRFEGVELHNNTTSAIIAIYDSCGKIYKKDKVSAGATKSFQIGSQQVEVTANDINSGLTIGDGGIKSGSVVLTVKVLCNLDGGMPADMKTADSIKADAKPKSDSKPAADSKPADATKSDAIKADAKPPLDAKPKSDSIAVGDSMPSDALSDALKTDAFNPACSQSGTGTFLGTVGKSVQTIVGGYAFLYDSRVVSDAGHSASSAILKVSCMGAAVDSSLDCPLNKPVVLDVPQDKKKITVTVNQIGIYTIKASIKVESN